MRVEKVENKKTSGEEYDTYPPPDNDFKYEDPYVTEEELRQIAVNPENSQKQRPRKPSSAYFYFVKKHRCRLQQQHPTWPMKRIVSSVAMLWSKTSLENRAPFVEMAKEDSNRYKEQVYTYIYITVLSSPIY